MSASLKLKILDFVLTKYKICGDKPWLKYPDIVVVRHSDNKKWFGIFLSVPREKLGLTGGGNVDVLNVKKDSVIIGSFVNQLGILPAWHMNKSSWCSILLDGTVPIKDIEFLISVSFELTKNVKSGKIANSKRVQNVNDLLS